MIDYFFIAGAQRSGTTYFYQMLDEHPQIEMAKPLRPEPKFFHTDTLFEKGLDFYKNHFFADKPVTRLRGEKSTAYIESEKAAARISECFPTAKIFFLLRDPIERAISHYWFSVKNGWETLPMEDAFLKEPERWQNYDHKRISVSPYAYLSRGRYIDYITIYQRYFPSKNIKVLLYEQFIDSQAQIRDVYRYLGVSDFVPTTVHNKVNKGNKLNTSLSPELEQYLIDYFTEPNTRLAEWLGMPLIEWHHT